MKFKVKCLYKDGRVMMPKELRCTPSFIGRLLLSVQDDVEQGSILLIARLVNASKSDLLPPLSGVEIVPGEDGEMLVRGHYYKAEHGLAHRQSWFLRPIVEH
jgi:hypothetical protein